MSPTIIGVKPELRSRGLDRLRCCWHVRYEFCGLSAEIAVTAENELKRAPRRSINFAAAALN
jgi:hypothetical protein